MIRRILADRRAAAAPLVAVMGIVLIGFAGFALDLTRAYMVSARLKTSVDAAALLAAREMSLASRDADATALFWVNYRRNQAVGSNYLGSSITDFTISQIDADRIQVSGTARLATTLFSVISRQDMSVTEISVAQRQGIGLELALVIDQTSSMGDAAPGGGTKLQAAQAAVSTLLDILYGSQDTQQNLWVSVVPFARSINIGTANNNMLDVSNMPSGWSLTNWSGCVEARYSTTTGGVKDDLTDASPTSRPFRPYFYQSTYQRVGTSTSNCTNANSYSAVNGVRYCFGDNDWGAPSLSSNPTYNYMRTQYSVPAYTGGSGPPNSAAGPNLMCALSPIQPLTASRIAVRQAVNAIVAPARSGGTVISTGMQGAWYTLSPNWQNAWPDPNPLGGPVLPLAYNTTNMRKAVIILTDGDNNWQQQYCQNSGNGCTASARYPAATGTSGVSTEFIYSAYGRGATWNAASMSPSVTPGTQSTGDAALDSRFASICTAMKTQGIIIYVIGFEIQTSAQRTMLQTCVTQPYQSYFFESPTASDLQAAFTQVANSLSRLRLSE